MSTSFFIAYSSIEISVASPNRLSLVIFALLQRQAMLAVISLSVIYSSVTVNLFRVKVPVLSVHITLHEPRVSTASNFLIIALFPAIFCIPNANVNVRIAGKPSGIAATAKLTAVMNVFAAGIPWNNSNINISIHIITENILRVLLRVSIFFSSGVLSLSSS